jgi:mono/diheme cytochrome c family protein
VDNLTETRPSRGKRRSGAWAIALFSLGALNISLLIACAGSAASPTAYVGSVVDQLARGAPLYVQNCATATCHGTRGEGIREGNTFHAFPLVGKELEERDPNAQVIFDVVRSGDEQNLRVMTDQQIYDAVAYELSQNGEQLTAPLTAENAAVTTTGRAPPTPAAIYPPLGGITFLTPQVAPRASWSAANDYMALRVDQIGQASAVGQSVAPNEGTFVLVVFALQALAHPLEVDPQNLDLYDAAGHAHTPEAVDFSSAIERFHHLTIQPGHGTAAIAVFALLRNVLYDRLVYDDGTGHPLAIKLSQ